MTRCRIHSCPARRVKGRPFCTKHERVRRSNRKYRERLPMKREANPSTRGRRLPVMDLDERLRRSRAMHRPEFSALLAALPPSARAGLESSSLAAYARTAPSRLGSLVAVEDDRGRHAMACVR